MKNVVVLGSTGSIGKQTLDICRQHPKKLNVVGLVANKSADVLLRQAQEHQAKYTALMDEEIAKEHSIPGGMDVILEMVTRDDIDIVVVSVAGVIGLKPTITAIEAGKNIALASKEVLVAAGEATMKLVKEKGISLTPIDSEHSALFQCMQGCSSHQVKSLILTASGGPFRGKSLDELGQITVEQALAHPTWNMGGKITIDSATMMNKGLETIEAKWLFGVEMSQVQVVVHPQSVVHSLVEFKDGSMLGQLGWPDMRLPIQYALLYPERVPNQMKPWNPVLTPNLTFEAVDRKTFQCLELAYEAAEAGGTMACALNAANEEAANGFIARKCSFLGIAKTVESVMNEHNPVEASLENVFEVDTWARVKAKEFMARNL